jgi:DNA mismatch endonuclease (patch repair protein)
MSRIRSKNTRPEVLFRKALFAEGLRFRLHAKELPGSPDIVLRPARIAVFVHGCYWHRHPGCRFATTPKTNTAFWEAKFSGNTERDKKVKNDLMEMGWMPITVWECEVIDAEKCACAAIRIREQADLRRNR